MAQIRLHATDVQFFFALSTAQCMLLSLVIHHTPQNKESTLHCWTNDVSQLIPVLWFAQLVILPVWNIITDNLSGSFCLVINWPIRRRNFFTTLMSEEKGRKVGVLFFMKWVADGTHLPTDWLFEPAKYPDGTDDYCLGCSFLPLCKHQEPELSTLLLHHSGLTPLTLTQQVGLDECLNKTATYVKLIQYYHKS